MKVSSCNTKNFLEFLGINPCTSQPKPKKPKKFTPPKNSLHFWKWKCIPLFSQKKAYLIFPEMEPCTFQQNLEIKEIRPWKLKWNFLIFWDMIFLSPKLKKFIIFQEGTCKA